MEITYDQATGKPVKIRMLKPADMHQHLRQDGLLELVAPMVAARFAMAIVMPNTVPPITNCSMALRYASEITEALQGRGKNFRALMTMYLTDALETAEVSRALNEGLIAGIKYYPRGLTTNSDSGVSDPSSLWTKDSNAWRVLRALAEGGGVLLIHAADGVASAAWTTDDRTYNAGEELDAWDQEKHFIERTLPNIADAHPNLKISVEHLSTMWGAEFMRKHGGKRLGCSLTAHHLLLDRRDLFRGGFHPHRSWMPVIQPKEHKDALRGLASEGYPFVWLGSDSAPHPREKKEAACCASGVLMAHAGIEFYVEAFEDMCALEKLENFASVYGPRFFGLEPSSEEISLACEEWEVKSFYVGQYASGGGYTPIVPFRLGGKVRWKLAA